MNTMNSTNKNIYIFAVVVICFMARWFTLSEVSVFQTSGDQVGFLLDSLKLIDLFSFNSWSETLKNITYVINFGWGYGHLVFSAASIAVMSILGFSITEVTVFLPYLVMASLTMAHVYLFLKRRHLEHVAFILTLVVGLSPVLISTARSNLNWHLSFCLLINYLLFLWVSMEEGFTKRRRVHAAMFCLAGYVICDSQFPMMMVVTFSAVVLFAWGHWGKAWSLFKENFPKLALLWPCATFAPIALAFVYFSFQGHMEYGFIGHNLEKNVIWANYLTQTFKDFRQSYGWILTLLAPLGLAYGICLCWYKKMKAIWMVMVLAYGFPWMFMVDRTITAGVSARCYMVMATVPLVLLSLEALWRWSQPVRIKRIAFYSVCALIVCEMLWLTFEGVYHRGRAYPGFMVKPVNGYVHRPQPVHKDVAIWVRETLPEDATIASFGEPPVARLLFHRPVIGAYDLNPSQEDLCRQLITQLHPNADYWLVEPKYWQRYRDAWPQKWAYRSELLHSKGSYHLLSQSPMSWGDQVIVSEWDGVGGHPFDRQYAHREALSWPIIWPKADL